MTHELMLDWEKFIARRHYWEGKNISLLQKVFFLFFLNFKIICNECFFLNGEKWNLKLFETKAKFDFEVPCVFVNLISLQKYSHNTWLGDLLWILEVHSRGIFGTLCLSTNVLESWKPCKMRTQSFSWLYTLESQFHMVARGKGLNKL